MVITIDNETINKFDLLTIIRKRLKLIKVLLFVLIITIFTEEIKH